MLAIAIRHFRRRHRCRAICRHRCFFTRRFRYISYADFSPFTLDGFFTLIFAIDIRHAFIYDADFRRLR